MLSTNGQDKVILRLNTNSSVLVDILLRGLRITKSTGIVSVTESVEKMKKEIYLFSLFGWSVEKSKEIELDGKKLIAVKYIKNY